MFVVRTEVPRWQRPHSIDLQEPVMTLMLKSLDSVASTVRFDVFATEKAAHLVGDEVYQRLFETRGQWNAVPSHSVYAIWQVTQPEHEGAFIESRRQLFEVRRRVLPTFAYDWLLKRTDEPGRYMVLGLYGDEAGATRLCREHPEIRQFLQAHPVGQYSAHDLTGLCCFRVI